MSKGLDKKWWNVIAIVVILIAFGIYMKTRESPRLSAISTYCSEGSVSCVGKFVREQCGGSMLEPTTCAYKGKATDGKAYCLCTAKNGVITDKACGSGSDCGNGYCPAGQTCHLTNKLCDYGDSNNIGTYSCTWS